MFLFLIRSKLPYLLNTFASKHISDAKIQIIHYNNWLNFFHWNNIHYVRKKIKLTKTNLIINKQNNKKMGLSKHTFEKTKACKKHQYKMKA
jgi:hypothetical protein